VLKNFKRQQQLVLWKILTLARCAVHNLKSTIGLLLILFLLLFAQVSSASTLFTGTESQAMGGTGRAAIEANEVGLLNPASFLFVSGYNLAVANRDFSNSDGGSTRNVLLHLSESQTDSMFPLAVTYLKTRDLNSTTNTEREDFHFTTGQMLLKNLALGIDVGKYGYQPKNQPKDSEWDVKLGFLYVPVDNWGFGLVFTNLLVTDYDFLKRGVEFGANYLFKDFFRMDLDLTYQLQDNPNHDGVVMLGMEHTFIKQIALRMGFRWDDPIGENYWTLGLGWNAPRIGFSYAYEKNVAKTNEDGHSFDLKIYF
jgi:hypothetical protein